MKLLKRLIIFILILEMLVNTIPSTVFMQSVKAGEIEESTDDNIQDEILPEENNQDVVIQEDTVVTEENPELVDSEEVIQEPRQFLSENNSEGGETSPGPGKYKITIQLQNILPQSEYTKMRFKILDNDNALIFSSNTISDYFPANKEDRCREISATVNLNENPAKIIIRAECTSLGENNILECEAPFNYGYCVDGKDIEEGEEPKTFCTYSIEGMDGKGPLYYIDANGEIKYKEEGQYKCFNGGTIGHTYHGSEEFWYVVDSKNSGFWNVNTLNVQGNCHLVLRDGVTLNVSNQVAIISGSSLTIYGQKYQTGTLEARGDAKTGIPAVSGIGGQGDITINGGHIIALGGINAPGIGFTGINKSVTGNITINGGTVEAQGGVFNNGVRNEDPFGGSGIGGYCKKITINGGTVTAKGGKNAAGIGGSFKNITINGGTITAVGDTKGAGIGGDATKYVPDLHDCGNIEINGGIIDASVMAANRQDECVAAAIGAGGEYGQTGNITIKGGKIRAFAKGIGAAIGTSSAPINDTFSIIIGTTGDDDSKLSIVAVAEKGAGIGKSGDSTGEVKGNIQINSGVIVAGSIESGAGIGGGREGDAGTITINGGKIYAQGAGANIRSISLNSIDPLSFYEENKELGSMIFLEEVKDDYLVRDLFYHTQELLTYDYLPHAVLPAAGIGSGGNGKIERNVTINGGIVAACSGDYVVSSVGTGMSTVNGKRFPSSKVQLYKDAKVAYGEYEDNQMKLLGVKEAYFPMQERKAAVVNNNFALIEPGKQMVIFNPGKDSSGNEMEIEGNLPDSMEVLTEMKIERPADPVHKSGENDGDYIFDDWYEDEAHTKPFDFDAPITGGVTIYANWVKAYPVVIQKKWDESVNTGAEPELVEITYEDKFKVGKKDRVRTGTIKLSQDKDWKDILYVTETSVITLSEKYIKGFKPTKQWQLSYQYIGVYGKHTANFDSEDNNRTIVLAVNESEFFKEYFRNNKVSRITDMNYYPWIIVTNGIDSVHSNLKAKIKWDPDDEDTVKPEYIEVILLKYDDNTNQWIKETGTSENPINPIKKVYASDNWEVEYDFEAVSGTEYLIREAYKENPSDSNYKIAFEGSSEEKGATKSSAIYGNIEYDVTYEDDFDNTTVITNHIRKFDYEVIWENPEDYNPYNEITIVLQYNDNGNWIVVDSTVIKRAPSGSPAGTPYKNVTITTDDETGTVHMNGTLRGWYKGIVTKNQETQKYRIREIANRDSDDPGSGEIEYAHWDTEYSTPPVGHDRGVMILHDESVVGRETHTYEVKYDADDNGKTIITNTQKGSFSVQKVWNSEYKPSSLDVILLEYKYNSETQKNYWKVIEKKTLSAAEDCDWKSTFNTIQSGTGDWDSKYCVQELDAAGNIVMDSDTSSFYRSSISNTDVYDENDQLMNKTEEFSITANIDEKETKLYFRPEYEIDVANGKVKITNNLRNGVNVTKVWKSSDEVGKPDSIKVVLQKKNDYGVWENVKDPVELNESNQFKTSFSVSLTNKNGSGYNFNDFYRIREVERIENEGEADQTVKVVYNGNDLDKPEDYKASVTYSVASEGGESTDVSYDVTYEIKENGDTVITNSNKEKLINIEKSWDIDFEKTDKPDSIQVLIQAKNGDEWENAGIVELSDTNSWKVSKALPETRKNGDKEEKIEYRVRELREETALSELMNGVKSQIEAGKDQYDSWISALKSNGKAYWDQLPKEIRDAADGGYDSLIDELNTTPENLYSKLMEQFAFASAENRIVYDEKDDEAKDIDEDDKNKEPNKVTYHVKEKSSLTYGTIEAHVTKYLVSYDESDDTYTIENQAILEIDVIKRWLGIGVDEEDMPDSVWVVLMYHPKAGQDGSIPTSSDGTIEYEIPVINPIEGGNDPISIISQLALGIDLGIITKLIDGIVPKFAIAKVTKDDNWTKKFVVSKYTFGLATEFKGAELGSEIIRQIIKYLVGIDLPISYNPFGGFISIPTKAIKTLAGLENPSDLFDLSKLVGAAKTKAESLTMDDIQNIGPSTLLDDWHLMANVINLKFAFDGRDENDPGKRKGVKVWEDDTADKRPNTLKIIATNVNDESDVKTVTLNKNDFGDSNQWSWTIDGTKDDAEYTYSEEYPAEFENADKYQLVVSGSTLINKWISNPDDNDKVTISGKKTWNDNNNANGKRPETITVRLYADGEEVASVKTSKAAGWKWYFANQPKKNAKGDVIKYTISEDSVENYESTVNGYNITNKCDTTTVGKTQVNVRKVWVDGNDKDNIRPSSITVKLYADGPKDTGKTLELNESNNWSGSFNDLPVKDETENRNIQYSVRETMTDVITGTDGDGTYSYEIEGDAKKGFTIYNYHTPKVTITGQKTWDDNDNAAGKRPDSITIRLLRDGSEVPGQIKTVTASDNWKWKFENLPGKVDGKLVNYSIREDAVDNYKSTIEADYANNEFTVTNKCDTETVGKTQVDVQKIWKDNDNSDGLRPENVKIWLYADGKKTNNYLELSAAGNWSGSFTDIPIYSDSSNTKRIKYSVKEELTDIITGNSGATTYSVNISGDATKGYTITNTHTSVMTIVSGKKTWNDLFNSLGSRPESITVRLKADGVEIDSKKVTARDEWKWSFTNLPLVQNGKKVKYTVSEDVVDNYITTVNGYDITNKYSSGKTQVNVIKVWKDDNNKEGIRPLSVGVKLYANGVDTSKVLTLTEDNEWQGSFLDLQLKDDAGKSISYSIREVMTDVITGVDGDSTYSSVISGNAQSGFTITNTHSTRLITLQGTKMWDFGNVKEEDRPTEIDVYLKEDGQTLLTADRSGMEHRKARKADGWKWSFDNLPRVKNGKEVKYTVVEYAMDGYISTINGTSILNTSAPGRTQVNVTKVWDDGDDADRIRPSSVTVKLFANNVETSRKLVLTEGNNWSGSFKDLAIKDKDDNTIEYSVREELTAIIADIDGPMTYKVEIDKEGVNNRDFTITNIHTPKKTVIEGGKIWDDSLNIKGKRPNSITIRLFGDGKEVAVKTVTKDDDWKWRFEVNKYNKGQDIVYTISEDAVDGYVSNINGYDVKNTLITTPQKCKITYVLNGGSYRGSREDIVEYYDKGTIISIHEAPERSGYDFTYWKGSEYHPGESYCVTGDHIFVAQWGAPDDNHNEYVPPTDPLDKENNYGNGKRQGPYTGDDTNFILLLVVLALSIGTVIYCLSRSKK